MESLSRQPDTAGIPIVIMTGDPDVDRTQMKLKGALEVFCKPMDVHAFLNTIRRALEPVTEPVPRANASREVTGSTTDLLPA